MIGMRACSEIGHFTLINSLARQPVHPNRLGWLTRTSTWNGLVGTVEAPQDHGHGCDGSQPPLP